MARQKREAPISIRPSREDRAKIECAYKNSNAASLSAFFVEAALGVKRTRTRSPSPLEHQMIVQLNYKLAGTKDLLQSVATRPGGEGRTEAVAECHAAMLEIRDALMVALGRQP